MTKTMKLLVGIGLSVILLGTPRPANALIDQFVKLVASWNADSKSYAVVIGINAYEHTTDLNYAVNDAKTMVKLLKSMGFIVPKNAILLRESSGDEEVDKSRIRQAVSKVLKKAGPKDRVIVFYAGHGVEIPFSYGNEAFLLPSNYNSRDDLGTGLSFKDLVRLATRTSIKAKHVLFILDACYAADALDLEGLRDSQSKDALDEAFYKELIDNRFVAALTAGDRGQKVKEIGGHGVFTKSLVRGLAGAADTNGNGVVHFSELVTYLEEDVRNHSGSHKQRVKSGRVVKGIGQVVFTVPSESIRKTILGPDESAEVTMLVRNRQNSLVRDRSGGTTISTTGGAGLSRSQGLSSDDVEAMKAELERLREAVDALNTKGRETPPELEPPKNQVDAIMKSHAQAAPVRIQGELDAATVKKRQAEMARLREERDVLKTKGQIKTRESSPVESQNESVRAQVDKAYDEIARGVRRNEPWDESLRAEVERRYDEIARGVSEPESRETQVKKSEPVQEARVRPYDAPQRLAKEITGKDGAPMVLVPAGKFIMGSNKGEDNEKPAHEIELTAFYIDKYEVTRKLYGTFMREMQVTEPWYWQERKDESMQQTPVFGVKWEHAVAYCKWASKRLPTEAEWEKAARGTDGRRYPWGNEAPTELHATYAAGLFSDPTAVGITKAGASPYGAYDMAGNVREWVADWYDAEYYKEGRIRNPLGPSSGAFKVLRGGYFEGGRRDLQSSYRYWLDPMVNSSSAGFRCAKNAT